MNLNITNENSSLIYLKKEGIIPQQSWNITKTSLVVLSISLRVSGAGSWAHLQEKVILHIRRLESSPTYQHLQQQQCISLGVEGFWNWLAEGVNASLFKQQLLEIFEELYREKNVEMMVEFDFLVTGNYFNISKEISPIIQVLNVTIADGNFLLIMSSESPCIDSGAVDRQDKSKVPTMNNHTKITSVSCKD